MARGSAAARIARNIGVGVGALLALAVGLVIATLVHLDLPVSRRLAALEVNRALASSFAGGIRIDRIRRLEPFGVSGVRVTVSDPEGVTVLRLDGVDVRLDTISLLRSLSSRSIELRLPTVFIGDIDVNLEDDPSGELRIARAFASRSPARAAESAPDAERSLVIDGRIRVGRTSLHGISKAELDLSDVAATVRIDSVASLIDVDRAWIQTRGIPSGLGPRGLIEGRLVRRSNESPVLRARFEGDVGGMSTVGDLRLRGDEVEARVDARDPTSANARAILSELSARSRLELRAEAHGTLPRLDAAANVSLGRASLDVLASIDTRSSHVDTRITGRSIDLAAIVEGGPSSDLAFDGRSAITMQDGEPHGELTFALHPGMVDQRPIPRVDLSSHFSGKRAAATARIHEAAMPTEIVVVASPRPGHEGRSIDTTIHSMIPDLRRVPLVGRTTAGSATIDATARLVLPEGTIDGTLDLRGSQLRSELGRVDVGHARGRGVLTGRIDGPLVDATFDGEEIVIDGRAIPRASATARLAVDRGITLRDVRAEVVYEKQAIGVGARRVRIEAFELAVEGAEMTGLGEPIHADIASRARRIRGRIDAPGIDLAKLSTLARLDRAIQRGRLSIRGEAEFLDGNTTIDLHAAVTELDAGRLRDTSLVLEAAATGTEASLELRGALGDAGEVTLRAEQLVVDGPLTDPRAWRRAKGAVRIDAQIDAEKVASALPRSFLPVAELRGEVTLQGRVARDREDGPPEIQLSAHTNGLFVAARSEPEQSAGGVRVEAPPRWRSTEIDLGLDLRTDGASGLTCIAARATDRVGAIVAIDGKTVLPWEEIRDPSSFMQRLLDAPISSKLVVPSRRLDQLPSIVALNGLEGEVSVDVDAAGTLRDPHVRFSGQGRRVHTPAMPPGMKADTDVVLAYDDGTADTSIAVRAAGRDLLVASSRLQADLRDLVFGERPAWKLAGHARLTGLPLEAIPVVADHGVRGIANGELSLTGLHEDARLTGSVSVDGFAVGATTYDRATVRVETGARAVARVRFERPDGFLDMSGSSGLAWGKELVPSLDRTLPIEASLVASSFRAVILQPFVDTVIPSFDGRIDADARLRVAPGEPPSLEGRVKLRDGTLHVAAIGEELRNARASVTILRDAIVVEDVYARGAQGEISASGRAVLEGAHLVEATADVRIPNNRPLRLAPDGQPIGQVSGTARLHAAPGPDGTELVVDVTRGTLVTPQITKGGLQELERRRNVHAGVFRGPDTFVTLPLDRADTQRPRKEEKAPAKTQILVNLGQVEIVRGNQAQVFVTGHPTVSLVGDEKTIAGQIELTRGWATVQGKKFVIERGTVTWSPDQDPENPTIVATAAWAAPDGTRVLVDFVGPVESGHATLRSEPPLPKSDILALVIFGTTSGGNPTPAPAGRQRDGTTRAAVGIGGSVAAEGLANALDDLTGLRATARIDTTRANNLRPEIEIQISPRVSISFAHVIGTPPITEPDRNLASIEYRFYRNWSVETTAGDRGRAMVDAIWQRRY